MTNSFSKLAIHGGDPVRREMLPYGKQCIDESDIAAVTNVLRSSWLTTGPNIAEFEVAFAQFVGAREAVAVSSGTAALHAAMFALRIGAGDEVIVPAMTFAASANCVAYMGARPIFVDVDPDTLLIDPEQVKAKMTPHVKAIIAVDYAGQPCDYDALRLVANGIPIVSDACHALGGASKGRMVGTLADLNTFSLHPVKHITAGEGGVITTSDPMLAQRMRVFRNHGITSDHRQREAMDSWFYEMTDLGYNYRLTDFQCALAMSQLGKLPLWLERRRAIAGMYDAAFSKSVYMKPLTVRRDVNHAYHLYVIRFSLDRLLVDRRTLFSALRGEGIGVNVHYIPVHLHPYYVNTFGTCSGLCPIAERAYGQILSLPIFSTMTDKDFADVAASVDKVFRVFAR